ncbi:MAG: cache domain-containing protein [Desulfovermiculus sp.]|nr:cache domain-containing protein [Desulfovermiculus sp.]
MHPSVWFANLRIRHKLLLVYSVLFLCAFSLAGGLMYVFVKNHIQSNIEEELENTTQTLLHIVSNSADVAIKNHLRAIAEKNLDIAAHFYSLSQAGQISEAKAKQRAKEVYQAQQIGSTGYIYCLNSQGRIVMHKYDDLMGADLSSYEFIQEQLQVREGYLEYDWKNPGEDLARPKALYMIEFKPWDWIISASSYREEFNELIKVQDLEESILSLRFGHSGYSFVLNTQGQFIIHPAYQGKNIFEVMPEQSDQAMHRLVQEDKGTIVYPWRNPGETNLRRKMVIFEAIPEFDWVVASSLYLDEFYAPLTTVGRMIAAIMAMVLLLVIPITWSISATITNPIRELMHKFSQGAEGDHSVRMEVQSTDEIGMLEKYFNIFMDHLQASRKSLKTEIADRKKAEDSIRKSEIKYRELVQNANSIILRLDMGGRITFFNEFAQNLFGYSENEILGRKSLGTLMPEIDSSGRKMQDLLLQAARYPEKYVYYETESLRRNGERIWVAWTNKAIRDAAGHIVEYLCVGHDISEAKKAEQEMFRMRQFLRHIIECMPSALISVDLNRRVTQWNQEAARLTGISPDRALERPLRQVMPQLNVYSDMLRASAEQNKARIREKIHLRFKDQSLFMNIMVYPVILDDFHGVVIRLDDVTSRVRMEEVMVQTEKMMSVGGLAAGMAHEINNPLGGILQNTQNITRRLSPALPGNMHAAQSLGLDLNAVATYLEQRRIFHFLSRIKESGERAAKIVDNMLTFSRNSERKKDAVNPKDVINKTIELAAHDYDLKKRYDFRNIQIVRYFADNVPRVLCVATEMEQVLLNLLRNAAQAMAEGKRGGSQSKIVIHLFQEGSWTVVSVEDNGPGMDEEIRKRIFEPFYTTKGVGVGTGLGLSVAYFIVTNNHNGEMFVHSAPHEGTKFIIRLPGQRQEFAGL